LLFGEPDVQQALGRVRAADCDGRDEHLPVREPGACIDDQIADRPNPIIAIDVVDLANLSVCGADYITLEILDASQHAVAPE
jgi:hypothetical protein